MPIPEPLPGRGITPEPSPAFGLIAWLKETRVVLPLKGVECRFAVCGAVAEVWLDQIYHQENREALDCLYQFPLPADAAVFACEIVINGRVIRARVEEREAARRLATKRKAAGYRTGLVEMKRDNLFTLNLGNVQPGDLIIVRLGYFQPLRHLGRKRTVEIPFCPGIRYIPGKPLLRSNVGFGASDDTDQVPDASRISPPRLDRLHPDAAYLSLYGRLDHEAVPPDSISSPTPPIGVREKGCTLDICLADGAALLDRDFVIRWEERPVEQLTTRAWTYQHDGHTYALLELKAPETGTTARKPMDFYFLMDRSGSMLRRISELEAGDPASSRAWRKSIRPFLMERERRANALQEEWRRLDSLQRELTTMIERMGAIPRNMEALLRELEEKLEELFAP